MNENNKTDDSQDDDFISKTQLKNEAKALQTFGKELTELSLTKLESLPLSETTIFAIRDYHKQSGNIAKKRHLAFIGKCLRSEDADAVKLILEQDDFNNLRKQKSIASNDELIEELLAQGDKKIQELLQKNSTLDRQKLRQLVRNLGKSPEGKKRSSAKQKLNQYLIETKTS
ncbi:DUF615 domain-containing protein [Aliikangiella marina]|uniref:DUF615 domain-containing protein n=1 Tax=Aliikangiella marina TaxID=1712262 RepID=A0A545TDT7_9GAMM|nr:ribosome biogenesis factor YjgA [Aliikangiella marina]TQV75388.1 DUF615 domain-containing protein [Aliikangiella marina]